MPRVERSRPSGERAIVAATIAALAFLTLAPLAFLVFGSLRSAPPGAPGARFTRENWQYALSPESLRAVGNSLLLGLGTAVLSAAIGVPIAWLIARTNLPGRRTLSSLMVVPMLFSPLLTALAYVGLFGPQSGVINALASALFGIKGDLLTIYSVGGMLLVLTLHYVPYEYLAVRAALLNMDPDLEDASRVLGSSSWRTARRITFPMMAPALFSAVLLVTVLAAEELSVPLMLGSGIGFPLLPRLIYENMTEAFAEPTRASALGLLLLVIMLLALALYRRALGSSRQFVTIGGKGARLPVADVARPLRYLGLAAVLAYLFLAVALPYTMLVVASFSSYFATTQFSADLLTTKNYEDLARNPSFLLSIRNTLTLLLVGATVTTLAAAVVARLSVRSRHGWQALLDYLAATPVLISGLVLGIGMLWAYVYIPLGLYGTLGILLVAYLTRYLGHGQRILSASFLQLSPELEEAAQTLGSSRVRTFRTITLPLLRAPLASAWLLIAIFISLEVASSVFLYTGQTITAALFVWLRMLSGLPTPAFAAATILATLDLCLIALAQWRLRALDKL